MKKTKENQLGITMIALIVTVIVLLILAGISIATLNGDSGIIKKSKEAKEQTEISEETEVVNRATVQAMGNNKKGDLIESELQEQLDKIASSGKTEVTDTGDEFEVLFKESNRCYTLDKEGNILEQQIIEKIEYAGDITKNGQYDGSAEKPYQISCIEDLVALSNMTNGKGIIYTDGKIKAISTKNRMANKYIELTRNLNFKSKYSYEDSKRTDFGDLNSNGTIETIKEELTNMEQNSVGFTPISTRMDTFFNGNNNSIRNIYIYEAGPTQVSVALFKYMGEVKNLKLTGIIKNDKWEAAGIVNKANKMENCINCVDVTGFNFAGGIGNNIVEKAEDCINYGNISITGTAYGYGGAGGINSRGLIREVLNCKNYGNISGKSEYVGGIIGLIGNEEEQIIDSCVNYGKINLSDPTWKGCGGIVAGCKYCNLRIINSINYGEVQGGNGGGIIGPVNGHAWTSDISVNVENCANFGNIYGMGGIVGKQSTICAKNYITIKNSYNVGEIAGDNIGNLVGKIDYDKATETKTEFENVYYTNKPDIVGGTLTSGSSTLKTKEEMRSQAFVDLLNQNIGSNLDWKKWKLGEKGYPVLDI